MNIEGSVALVTGANRGLGEAFTRLLVENGAAKVYGGARDPGSITVPGVVPVKLDITSAEDVAAAAALAADVTLVINNAGISTGTSVLADDALAGARREIETNVLGPLVVSRAFAPVLAANGGGAIVNVLSVLSWLAMPQTAMYSAAKAAAWSLTNSLRVELAPQGTLVVGVHVGFMDTDMAAGVNAPKASPASVAEATLEALREGRPEVLADDTSRFVKAQLSGDLADLYPSLVRA
ncbi:MAG TPA: SDR family oxidoreductase [Acidimicrobiales bacterium]|nr:SDR family oxidoreductase [Acidimicrobiales bacterium]